MRSLLIAALLYALVQCTSADKVQVDLFRTALQAGTRTVLGTKALQRGHPFIHSCVESKEYPLELHNQQTYTSNDGSSGMTLTARGAVHLRRIESDAEAASENVRCHYELTVQFHEAVLKTAGSGEEHPFEMHKMLPYWSAAEDLMKVQPVSFRQGFDGEISDVRIGILDVSANPRHGETERLQEGMEDAIWALLFQLEFKSDSMGSDGHVSRTSTPHANRGHHWMEGNEYRVHTTYAGEERLFEAPHPGAEPIAVNVFRVDRLYKPDQRKPANVQTMYMNRRIVTENFVRAGEPGVIHSQQRQVMGTVKDRSIIGDPRADGVDLEIKIESLVVLGEPQDFAPELKMLLLEPIHEFAELGPEARHPDKPRPEEEASRAPSMRFKSTKSKPTAREGVEMRKRRQSAPLAPAAAAAAMYDHRFSSMRKRRNPSAGGNHIGRGGAELSLAFEKEVKFGGKRDILGYFSGGVKVAFDQAQTATELKLLGIVDLGGYFWGQKFTIMRFLPGVSFDFKEKPATRKWVIEFEKPSGAELVEWLLKFFGAHGKTDKAEKAGPAEEPKCSMDSKEWLLRPVDKYMVKLYAGLSPNSKLSCVGAVSYGAIVWGIPCHIRIKLNLVPYLTIAGDYCKDEPTKEKFAALGLKTGGRVSVTIVFMIKAGALGFKFDAPGMCDANFGVGVGGSGTVHVIDLSWQFAYNAPVKDPRSGCISSKPAGSMLGGNIKIVAEAMSYKWEYQLWEKEPTEMCIDIFESLARTFCMDKSKAIGNKKVPESGPEDFPRIAKAAGLFKDCGEKEEFVSRQRGATPLFFKKVGDKWEWTPYEKGIESDSRYKKWGKPRLWLPVTKDTLPADAPIWPGAKPVEANLRILGILSGRIPALLPDPLAEELAFEQLSENEYMKDYWDTTPIWFKKTSSGWMWSPYETPSVRNANWISVTTFIVPTTAPAPWKGQEPKRKFVEILQRLAVDGRTDQQVGQDGAIVLATQLRLSKEGKEYISRLTGEATPLWLRPVNPDGKKWEWTPFSPQTANRGSLWMPCSSGKVKNSAPRWADEAPVKKNLEMIARLNFEDKDNPLNQGMNSNDPLALFLGLVYKNNLWESEGGWFSSSLWFKRSGGKWQWTPDKSNWMPTSTVTVRGGSYNGRKPTDANQETIKRLEQGY